MGQELLFDTIEEKEATERVLALVRVKNIGSELDNLLAEIIKFSSNVDKILERNGHNPRYLERLGILESLTDFYLDDDLLEIDFRVKEVVEDLIKRINTRVSLVKNNELLITELKETYKINEEEVLEDIKKARLDIKDFIEE